MALSSNTILSSFVGILLLFCAYRVVWRQFFGEQDCEMTYMYEWPQYQEVPHKTEVQQQYPRYSLYLYKEGTVLDFLVVKTLAMRRGILKLPQVAFTLATSSEPPKAVAPKVNGIPVLFLPGNAGSYKQGRSSGSISLRMHAREFAHKKHFDVFTVNFDEELSGMFGGVLQRQTEFLAICIDRVLSLYKHVRPRPHSVVLIGHSMGGVIARGLFVDPDFDPSLVTAIIALSSPLLSPVVSFDWMLQDYYSKVNSVWSDLERNLSSQVTMVSISGGLRDVMVPTHLSILPSTPLTMASPAIPRNWASADHLAIVWCRRVQLALTRSLFHLQDKTMSGLTTDVSRREDVFHHLIEQGHLVPFRSTTITKVKQKRVRIMESDVELSDKEFSRGITYVAFPLPKDDHTLSVIASNTDLSSWLYLCSGFSDDADTISCSDLSSMAHLLPPKDQVIKHVTLDANEIRRRGFTRKDDAHIVVHRPTSSKSNGFVVSHQCLPSRTSHLLPWLKSRMTLPTGHCPLVNISLPGFGSMWHSYTVEVKSQCGGVAGALVTPWYPHHAHLHDHSPSGTSSITLHLDVLATPTPSQNPATPSATEEEEPARLVLWSSSKCELELEVTVAPLLLLDKLAVLYAPYLLPWLTAVCLTASCRCLHWEMLAISLLCLASRCGWIDPSILFGSSPLWSGCGPFLIHLVSCGLQYLLCLAIAMVTDFLGWCCFFSSSRFSQSCSVLSWGLVLVGGAVALGACSGLGFTVAFVGFLLQVKRRGQASLLLREVGCVLFCLLVLLLPCLFMWIRGARQSLQLSPDPHTVTSVIGILLTALLLYLTPVINTTTNEKGQATTSSSSQSPTERAAKGISKRHKSNGFSVSKAFFMRGVYFSLGAAVILGCMEVHRMVGPVFLYLIATSLLLYSSGGPLE